MNLDDISTAFTYLGCFIPFIVVGFFLGPAIIDAFKDAEKAWKDLLK